MRVFATKWFARFARREGVTASMLCEAVERAERGIVDADLGGCVLKQRIARSGEGRSGGYRTILLLRIKTRAVFVYGFSKNNRTNIEKIELEGFKALAAELLGYGEKQVDKALETGALQEIDCDD